MKRYVLNILISIDQLLNTVAGGDYDETISSRLGKWHRSGADTRGLRKLVYQILNPIVNLFEKNHFARSIEEDEGKNGIIK